MPPENDSPLGRFESLLKRIARVPKREIDEQERIDARNKERRKTKRPAKPGHIVPAQPDHSR